MLFVHGYHSSFESAALTMGELCHFLGRDFVCGIFTWPAGGRRGILFGYDVDRESAEYAVEDLVKVIRIVAGRRAWSEFTSSRTAAARTLSRRRWRSSAPRPTHSELAGSRVSHRQVVLVAPDLDGDVALNKIFKVFSDPDLPFGGERTRAPSFRLHLASGSPCTFRPTTRRSRVGLAVRQHRPARADRRDDVQR